MSKTQNHACLFYGWQQRFFDNITYVCKTDRNWQHWRLEEAATPRWQHQPVNLCYHQVLTARLLHQMVRQSAHQPTDCAPCLYNVPWTVNAAKKTNEWVLNKAVKARKLAYYRHTMRKQGNCLEKEIMQGTMPGARRRGRPHTAWMDNIKTWTGFPVEESIRMTEDRDK